MILLLALAVAAPVSEPTGPNYEDDAVRHEAQVQVLDAMVEAGLAEQALVAATDIRAKEGGWPALDLVQARALHASGMLQESEEILAKLVRRHPRDAGAWALLGLVRADRADTEGAITALERAVRVDPTHADWFNNLGFLYLAVGRHELATTTLRAALRIDPASPRTRNNLAFALAADGKDNEALELFRSVADEADARYNLGVACERRGDVAGALTQYQLAIASRPHPAATTALNRLLEGS